MEEGIVAGGGATFLTIRKKLDGLKLDGDQATGVTMVRDALSSPLFHIAENAGHEGAVMVQAVEAAKGNTGLNAATGELEDLLKAGILDPAKVLRTACQNAVSVAGAFITTECLISDAEDEDAAGGGDMH